MFQNKLVNYTLLSVHTIGWITKV